MDIDNEEACNVLRQPHRQCTDLREHTPLMLGVGLLSGDMAISCHDGTAHSRTKGRQLCSAIRHAHRELAPRRREAVAVAHSYMGRRSARMGCEVTTWTQQAVVPRSDIELVVIGSAGQCQAQANVGVISQIMDNHHRAEEWHAQDEQMIIRCRQSGDAGLVAVGTKSCVLRYRDCEHMPADREVERGWGQAVAAKRIPLREECCEWRVGEEAVELRRRQLDAVTARVNDRTDLARQQS